MSNAVQFDRQWVRRIMKEEKCILSEMKQKAAPSDGKAFVYTPYEEEKKYGVGDDQYSTASKSAIDRAFAREYGDDDLELSSKWSVQTPKTIISEQDNKSIGKMSLKSSSKMSSSKAGSQYSSASAKKRVSELERVPGLNCKTTFVIYLSLQSACLTV